MSPASACRIATRHAYLKWSGLSSATPIWKTILSSWGQGVPFSLAVQIVYLFVSGSWILMPENTVIVKHCWILPSHLPILFEQVLEILSPIFPVVEFFWSCTSHENWIFFGYGVAISWNKTISKSISFKGQNNQQENSFRVYHDFEKETKILSVAGSFLLQKCPYHFWVTRSKSLLKVLKAQSARTINCKCKMRHISKICFF